MGSKIGVRGRVEGEFSPAKVAEISRQILDIIFDYALNKFDDSKVRLEGGAQNFLPVIGKFVAEGKRVEACLPSFPFKSANKVYKVLGSLPDKAEELAMQRLHAMCCRVKEVYAPGAHVTIVSDGVMYNDLLSISDSETWTYAETLRKMSISKGFTNIGFSEMRDLLDFPLPPRMTEIIYVANCTTFRRLLLNKYGRDDLDIDKEIASNPDTMLTYLGYKRFLESDLKHIFPQSTDRTANGYKRDCKYLAKEMLIRGHAFAGAVKNTYPDHLRLSIHESLGLNKVSVCLLNTRTGFTTPWHCSVARLADGEWISAPMGEFLKDDRLQIVYEDGRASHFEEKPPSPDVAETSSSSSLGISEETASYLQVSKPLNAAAYLSGASSPRTVASPSAGSSPVMTSAERGSYFLAAATAPESAVTTPQTQSPQSSASNGLKIVIEDIAPLEQRAQRSGDVPYGKRLIPQIMDSLAAAEPDRVVFSLATLSEGSLSLRPVSARHFTQAVDKTAWWLLEQVGKPDCVEPVGYIGPHDLRHVLLTYACVKAGYSALFLSPKNNTEGALAVLRATKCNIWVKDAEGLPVPLVKDIVANRDMRVLQLPVLDELLDAASVVPFAYTKTFEEVSNEPFCILHTSGTTGVPKPIPWSHALIGTMDAVRLLPRVEGDDGLMPWTFDWCAGDRIYSAFPMSHGAGIIMDILMPALFNLHCVLGPVDVLPNVNLVESLAEHASIDIWSMVPSLVDELGETPDVLAKLSASKFICASGGPVNPVRAAKVNEVVRVLNLTGPRSCLFIGNLVPAREDWFWFGFHPYAGFEFRKVDEDTYEHWVHRIEDKWDLFQGIFHTFPDKQSINLKDLYKRHPTKPNLWAFKGRSDDLVVLSNGYKISPLDLESYVATHPAIKGCLVFGTGRPQAGLLIELEDSCHKTDADLIDSIWQTVHEANQMSRHKNQLLRDFVTFAEADKPFFRTDKGTIKRPATLALYADYIERFYSSRGGDEGEKEVQVTVDATCVEAVQAFLGQGLASSVPAFKALSPDAGLFEMGLDSLGVFAAIKAIRAATGLGEQLAPRHIYANPSIPKLAAVIVQIANEARHAKEEEEKQQKQPADLASMKAAIAQHRARQSFRLNAFDYVNPNHGMGLVFYFALRDGISQDAVYDNLQRGLNRTFDMIPALGGKIVECSPQEVAYVEGDLCVSIPPLSQASSVHNRLIRKDLSDVLPPFEELRAGGFVPSAFKDSLVLRDDAFPRLPADIFVGQVSFVKGGCIVAVDLNHCSLDGLGAMVAVKAWAENCRYLQGDEEATCAWYDPESYNHSLPEILHDQEGWAKPLEQIDPRTWGFLPFFPPASKTAETETSMGKAPAGALPPPPVFPLHSVWPLPRAERCLRTTLFRIPAAKLRAMKQDVVADPAAKGIITNISDIVQAFFWRAAIRARYRVATEIHKQTFSPDDLSILELPTDGRPYFSPLLPSTYMGSMLLLNRSFMPISTLCSSSTSIGAVALLLRQSAARVTPALVHDAFELLRSLPDHGRFSTANMGLEHMHAMISNLIMFPADELRFGEAFFASQGGCPEAMRPQLERGNGRFRFLVVYPMTKGGDVELGLGTHPEELDMFLSDTEFTKYAELVD